MISNWHRDLSLQALGDTVDKRLHNKIISVVLTASSKMPQDAVTLTQANEIAGALIRDLAIESQPCDCGSCGIVTLDGEFGPDA